MKKLLLISVLGSSTIFAELLTIVPYTALIKYDTSSKDKANILGNYLGYGDFSYYLEFDVSSTNVKYVDQNLSDLKQNDLLLTYSSYGMETMTKLGVHYIDTTDTNLNNGIIYIGAIESYFWENYNKIKIGTELYFSDYKSGTDNVIKQITPYFGTQQVISYDVSNNLTIKLNYIDASKDYISYEIEDTLSYRNFSTTLKYFTGRMKTGIKDGGSTVFNTEDILLSGYGIKLTKIFLPNLSGNISYGKNNFKEKDAIQNSSNSVTAVSVIYSF